MATVLRIPMVSIANLVCVTVSKVGIVKVEVKMVSA